MMPKQPTLVFITSKETQHVSITKINRLMLFWKIVAVYFEKHETHNALCGTNADL
jgi:hypothetical protein